MAGQYMGPEEALEAVLEREEKEEASNPKEVLEKFRADQAAAEAFWSDIYSQMEKDWDIYNLEQWSEHAKIVRANRPMMTVDISRKFIKSVVSETSRNPPSIKLTGTRNDVRLQALAGGVRYFEDRTGSSYAYTWAKECAAVAGLGWIRVCYRVDDQEAIPAVIDIDKVDDPLSIMIDPEACELDGSDANFFIETHSDSRFTYWKKEDSTVKWYIISGNEIEEEGTWPTPSCPLVPVYGEMTRIRNKPKLFGLIRQITDTQRAYNYSMSELMERMALTPKSPVVAAEGSISPTYMKDWKRSATQPVPILFYNPVDKQGNPLPAPIVGGASALDISWGPTILQQLQMTANETTGISPASYGDSPTQNPESGIAIKEKLEASDRGQLVYDEHLQAAVRHVGEIVLSLFEPVLGPTGVLPVMLEDGTKIVLQVGVPQMQQDPQTGAMAQVPPVLDNLSVQDLQVSVSAAPAYSVRKKDGLDVITGMLPTLDPAQSARLVPALIRDMDFPGAETYATLLEGEQGPEQGMDPQALQALQQQLQEAQMQNQQMQQQLQSLDLELKTQSQAMIQKALIDSETKKAIKQMEIEAAMAEKQMTLVASSQETDKGILSDQALANKKAQTEMAKIAAQAQQSLTKISAEQQRDAFKASTELAKNAMQTAPVTLSNVPLQGE